MKRQRLAIACLAGPLLAALMEASIVTEGLAAERTPTWGWKENEGLGATHKQHPAPKQNAWQPKVDEQQSGQAAPAAEQPPPASVKSYCENIADPALDARFLHQKAELARLEEELGKKTTLLEEKKVEFQRWMKRRDEFVAKAQDNLLKLYAKMKPDAAALQLAAMDEEAAAALLLKLSARTSSAILNQMDSAKGARLVSVMIGAGRPSDKLAATSAPPQRSDISEGGIGEILTESPSAQRAPSPDQTGERSGESPKAQDNGKS